MELEHALLALAVLHEVDVALLSHADLGAHASNAGRLALVERLEGEVVEAAVREAVAVVARVRNAREEVAPRELAAQLGDVAAAQARELGDQRRRHHLVVARTDVGLASARARATQVVGRNCELEEREGLGEGGQTHRLQDAELIV